MDEGAFGKKIAAERPFLLNFLRARYRIAAGTAEDFVQDALLRAWAARSTYVEDGKLRGWLLFIMLNGYKSHKRRAWRTVLSDDMTAFDTASPSNQFDAVYLREVLERMQDLTWQMEEAIVALALGDHYAEAAAAQDVAEGTIKSRCARGRKELRKLLGEKNGSF